MAFYRKKPVVIEAFCWAVDVAPEWFRGYAGQIMPGDYVIKDETGGIYPCKGDIFEAEYDAAPAPEECFGCSQIKSYDGEFCDECEANFAEQVESVQY